MDWLNRLSHEAMLLIIVICVIVSLGCASVLVWIDTI